MFTYDSTQSQTSGIYTTLVIKHIIQTRPTPLLFPAVGSKPQNKAVSQRNKTFFTNCFTTVSFLSILSTHTACIFVLFCCVLGCVWAANLQRGISLQRNTSPHSSSGSEDMNQRDPSYIRLIMLIFEVYSA